MTEHAAQRRTTEPNYVRYVLDFFARMGSAEAIVHGESRYTYAETRAAVLAMAAALTARGVRGNMTAVAVFPFATTSGQVPALLALFQGGTAVLMMQFRAAQWLAAIERERVTSTLL